MRFDLSLFGMTLLAVAMGSNGAKAFSEQTVGGASGSNQAQYQDVDDLLNAKPFDSGSSSGLSSNLTDKSSQAPSIGGFSFSGQSNQGENYQPYGPWTIQRH